MLWQFVVLVCFCTTLVGCLFPTRTFVSDKGSPSQPSPSRVPTQAQPRPAQIPEEIAPKLAAPQSDADDSKPSLWSNWLGAISPKRPEPKNSSQPPRRIPLPRTDGEREEDQPGTAQVEIPSF